MLLLLLSMFSLTNQVDALESRLVAAQYLVNYGLYLPLSAYELYQVYILSTRRHPTFERERETVTRF